MISVDDIREECGDLDCDLCQKEKVKVGIILLPDDPSLLNALNSSGFAITRIGEKCRNELEAGLRAARKWEVRGGRQSRSHNAR